MKDNVRQTRSVRWLFSLPWPFLTFIHPEARPRTVTPLVLGCWALNCGGMAASSDAQSLSMEPWSLGAADTRRRNPQRTGDLVSLPPIRASASDGGIG